MQVYQIFKKDCFLLFCLIGVTGKKRSPTAKFFSNSFFMQCASAKSEITQNWCQIIKCSPIYLQELNIRWNIREYNELAKKLAEI